MGRRYEEIEERKRRDVDGVKDALKGLGDRERAHVLAWLLHYFEDSGTMRSPQAGKPRKRIVLDGVEYWLAGVPKRRH